MSHFAITEFEKDAPVPPEAVAILECLCSLVLEPIRAKFGPLVITSGYRLAGSNHATGGVPDSQHIYTATAAAADFECSAPFTNSEEIFLWLCQGNNGGGSGVPFDQAILEHD